MIGRALFLHPRLPYLQAAVELRRSMGKSGVAMLKPLCKNDSLVSFRCADLDGYAIEVYWEPPDAPLD